MRLRAHPLVQLRYSRPSRLPPSSEAAAREAHLRRAQQLELNIGDPNLGELTRRAKQLNDATVSTAELKSFMDSGRMLNLLEQTDLGLSFVSSGLNVRSTMNNARRAMVLKI